MNGLALCAGIGGLELGISLAEPDYRTVCWVERDPYAACVMAARMAEGALDEAPVWDDVSTFNGRCWRGVVDLVATGFPCQPHSTAGMRYAVADERWLWDEIARILGEVEPRYVFIENVPGMLTSSSGLAFGRVLRSLAALGFDAEWPCVRASECRCAPPKRAALRAGPRPRPRWRRTARGRRRGSRGGSG